MEKVDLRTLTPEAREEMWRVVTRLYKQGKRQSVIAMELGLRPTTVSSWVRRYESEGMAGLKELDRGRPMQKGSRHNNTLIFRGNRK